MKENRKNIFNQFVDSFSTEKLPQQSSDSHLSEEDSKRVKVNPTRNVRLYPVLSDIESQVTESDRDDCTTATMSEEQNYLHSRSHSEEDRWDKVVQCFLFCMCIDI